VKTHFLNAVRHGTLFQSGLWVKIQYPGKRFEARNENRKTEIGSMKKAFGFQKNTESPDASGGPVRVSEREIGIINHESY